MFQGEEKEEDRLEKVTARERGKGERQTETPLDASLKVSKMRYE